MTLGNILIVENYRPFATLLETLFAEYVPSAKVARVCPETGAYDPNIVERVRRLTKRTNYDLACVDAALGSPVVDPLLELLRQHEETQIVLYDVNARGTTLSEHSPDPAIRCIPFKADLTHYVIGELQQ